MLNISYITTKLSILLMFFLFNANNSSALSISCLFVYYYYIYIYLGETTMIELTNVFISFSVVLNTCTLLHGTRWRCCWVLTNTYPTITKSS